MVLVIVVCYIGVLSKEWFLSLWFVIYEFCQRSGSCHCGLLYRSFVKGVVLVNVVLLYRSFVKAVVLVIVVCYIGILSKEWFLSLWVVI